MIQFCLLRSHSFQHLDFDLKYFIVGAFPPSNSPIIGGQITACRNLFPLDLYPQNLTFRFDSTQVSNPPPRFFVRLYLSIIKISSFAFHVYRHQPTVILILFTSGFSIVEKFLFVLIARFCSPSSAIIVFPRSDVILTQIKNNFLFRKALSALFHLSSGIVFQSPSFCNSLPYLSSIKSIVVPNSIDSSLYPFADLPCSVGADDTFKILFVGWLEPVKQVHLILSAVRRFLDKHQSSNISLSIVGDGSCRTSLESLSIELNLPVTFHGWVADKSSLSSLYANSSCLCLPSKQEGFPNVVLEALIHSLPVISTPVGALPYFFVRNTSILFSSSSPDDICQSLERLYFDCNLRTLIQSRLSAMAPKFDPLVVSSSVKTFVDSFSP